MKKEIINYLNYRKKLSESTKKISQKEARYHDGIMEGLNIAIDRIEKELKDEPEKPVLPKVVADWIERAIERDLNLYGFLKYAPQEAAAWIFEGETKRERVDIVARAWLDGYEIEKETKYHARHVLLIKDTKFNYLNKNYLNKNKGEYLLSSADQTELHKTEFTENELDQLGVWDNIDWEIEPVD